MTEPGFMSWRSSRRTSFGALAPGNSTAPITRSARESCSSRLWRVGKRRRTFQGGTTGGERRGSEGRARRGARGPHPPPTPPPGWPRGGKWEVGEPDLPLAHPRPLGLVRLLPLAPHPGLAPPARALGQERPARHAIRLVRNPRADPRALLHEHAVPVAYQRLDSRRHQRHTVLGGFDLFGDANDHACSPA